MPLTSSSDPQLWFDAEHSHAAASVFLVTRGGDLILQLRDDIPNIDNPGMITTFGGQAEQHETAIDCALRELEEETRLRPDRSQLGYVGSISKVDWQGNNTACVFFVLAGVDPKSLVVTEGTAIVLTMRSIEADPRVTAFCRQMAARIVPVPI